MTRYLIKRLGQSLLTIFLTVSTVFILVRLAPGDPAQAYAGPFATTEQLEEVRRQFGLDRPILEQYWVFLKGLVRGDLGTSFSFQAPALDVVLARLPYTITLAVSAILLTTVSVRFPAVRIGKLVGEISTIAAPARNSPAAIGLTAVK